MEFGEKKWCLFCPEDFKTGKELLDHVTDKHMVIGPNEMKYAVENPNVKDIPCQFCNKIYKDAIDLDHHIRDNHTKPKDFDELQKEALHSQKNWFDIDRDAKGVSVICTFCFKEYDDIDKLIDHCEQSHGVTIKKDLLMKLQSKLKNISKGNPDECDRCGKIYYGIIATMINKESQCVCFNCYEEYWGSNAFKKLTMAAPPEEVERMRKPISK